MTTDRGLSQQTVRFHLNCPEEPVAFLVLREPTTGAKQTWPMTRGGDGGWEQSVALGAGRYHARFYAGDDRRVIYYGPAQVRTRADVARAKGMEGLDAVIDVLPSRCAHPADN
jgi:hypothetical protein